MAFMGANPALQFQNSNSPMSHFHFCCVQLCGRTLRVQHVSSYRAPKVDQETVAAPDDPNGVPIPVATDDSRDPLSYRPGKSIAM